jgi:superfamily I DNA/RNA helicase
MKFAYHKDLLSSIRDLYQMGGRFQTAANTVDTIIGRIDRQAAEPFKGINLTNYGESRIEHCVKYDLTGYTRLITIQDNGICAFCFVGKHEDCDNWLERNRGLRLTIDRTNTLTAVFKSKDISQTSTRIATKTDYSAGKLFEKIPRRYYERMSAGMPPEVLEVFENMESLATEEEILESAYLLPERRNQDLFFDVFCLLVKGDVTGAKYRIDLFTNEQSLLDEVEPQRVEHIIEGDGFADQESFGQLYKFFIENAGYREWMLFMGPEQREVVNKDFSGPAKLTGVSGSGKTCVVIKRAIRLATKYEGERILILTLNRSLATLISNLVDYAAPENVKRGIVVRSFWELCQEELKHFEPENFERLYRDVSWKHDEHISDIWTEFYDIWKQRDCNNLDAHDHLFPVHRFLLSRSIYPKDYIGQEFDWIRSAFPILQRNSYLDVTREGRTVPFTNDLREAILHGLECWENKMKWVGVIDYLGLAVALHKHFNDIPSRYRSILIDEAQDFGTVELQIVRKLVPENDNDIFLSGDIAQRVYTKHHKVKSAGIDYTGRTMSISRNYRNSREILSAAYNVFKSNSAVESFQNEDFEILDPEFANYSTPKPLVLNAKTLNEEIVRCYNYLRSKFTGEDEKKACIAIAGYSMNELKTLSSTLNLPILDGTLGLSDGVIFLSDLEQTKGYEFDSVCILNVNKHVIPNPDLPEAEWYRELSKFYVAMTRAKRELIISFSSQLSEFVQKSPEYFVFANWSEHEERDSIEGGHFTFEKDGSIELQALEMTGVDFLYTKRAIGCPNSLQQKLLDKVTGRDIQTKGKRIGWRTLRDLFSGSQRERLNIAREFGHQDLDDLYERLKDLVVAHSNRWLDK